jgi:hypothetical protein
MFVFNKTVLLMGIRARSVMYNLWKETRNRLIFCTTVGLKNLNFGIKEVLHLCLKQSVTLNIFFDLSIYKIILNFII